MSNIKFYLYKLKTVPLKQLIPKGINKVRNLLFQKILRSKDMLFDSHISIPDDCNIYYSYINVNQLNVSGVDKEIAEFLCEKYLEHKFDILGSGWVKTGYKINPVGLEGHKYNMSPGIKDFDSQGNWMKVILNKANLKSAKKIWCLVEANYEPIDWQYDFKSGYRWNTKKWYLEQKASPEPGADIKVTWELSRLQHLPQLAIIALVLSDKQERIVREFKNQILDFISSNPPRMGVTWTCTMDVGIRAANMVLAYDIFVQMDKWGILDGNFRKLFAKSITEHGIHIVNNFEWSQVLTSNHYLANICGLLYVSAYLERCTRTDAWFAFSVQEVISEFGKQFHKDGSNFEASTSYHRLSAEMIVFSAALVLGSMSKDKIEALNDYDRTLIDRLRPKENLDVNEIFPEWFIDRFSKMGLFTSSVTKPNVEIHQIGDNDNGRFINIFPKGKLLKTEDAIKRYINLCHHQLDSENYFDENILDHSALVSQIAGLVDHKFFIDFLNEDNLWSHFVSLLAGGKTFKQYNEQTICCNIKNTDDGQDIILPYKRTATINLEDYNYSLTDKYLSSICFPDFGVCIIKSDNFYLALFAGKNGQNGNGGHTHNDKGSFDLYINGVSVYSDPGTYLYTALPEMRNKFRSVIAHNTIQVSDKEQNEYLNLFSMKDQSKCTIKNFNKNYIHVTVKFGNIVHERKISIKNDKILIEDLCNFEFKLNFNINILSNGYGKLIDKGRYQNGVF